MYGLHFGHESVDTMPSLSDRLAAVQGHGGQSRAADERLEFVFVQD